MLGSLSTRRRWHLALLAALSLLMALPGLSTIPVIDRDEARYAQASVQMVETGDPVEIRLGDRARNQKPAGAYWAQSLSILATGGLRDTPGATLWAQRLPSVAAALLAVWLTYLAGVPMVGRTGGLIAGALLATSLIFVFEAHIAKTDALLVASTTGMLCAAARLRAGRARGAAWLFWMSLGLGVLIKGPVAPTVAALAVASLLAWEREASWARPLLRPLPILGGLLVFAPWLVAIGVATDGQFFADSLGRDLGGKLAGEAESHGGPPGYYAATVWLSLWPASLFLLPGLVFAVAAARHGGDSLPARGMRLVLAWSVPFWLVLELTPTKLIHYPLPVFPALCIAAAGGILAVWGAGGFRGSRALSALGFAVGSAAVIAVVLGVQLSVGERAWDAAAVATGALAGLCALGATAAWLLARTRLALALALLSAVPLSTLSYGTLLPRVEAARVSQRIAALAPPPLVSPRYQEASLRYYSGTDAVEWDVDWHDWAAWARGSLVVPTAPGQTMEPEVLERARRDGVCLDTLGAVDGINYSRGETVSFTVVHQVPCAGAAGGAMPVP